VTQFKNGITIFYMPSVTIKILITLEMFHVYYRLSYYSHNMTRVTGGFNMIVTGGFNMIEDFGNVKITLQNYKIHM